MDDATACACANTRGGVAALVVALWSSPVAAQTATYHLHKEASSTSGHFQAKTAGPDGSSLTVQSVDLPSAGTGPFVVKRFDTATGVPNTAGNILVGSTVSFTVWMRKTMSAGTMRPLARVKLNDINGAQLCEAQSAVGTNLTTTLTAYTLSCTTTAIIPMSASDRLFVYVGVNVITAVGGTATRAELNVEGTLNGTHDSRVTVPLPVPPPVITLLNPTSGAVGQVVMVSASNFAVAPLTIAFNGTPATPGAGNEFAFATTVPAGATTGPVVITVGGVASNGYTFTVAPRITTLSPNLGPAGTPVTIAGENFGTTQGGSTVAFNGTPASPTSWSPTSIGVTVPVGATSGNVVVTANGMASSGALFTVTGTLATPLPTPTEGAFRTGQSVVLTASPSATIRLTTDGSEPTASSTQYSAPLAINETTVLKAKAFQFAWIESATLSATYVIDSVPPTITISAAPGLTSLQWSNRAVTVSFECRDLQSGIASCPSGSVIDFDTSGTTVSGTAYDVAGNDASAEVIVRIDRTAPVVAVSAPANGSTSSASIAMVASVSDALSGLGSVTCNGEPVPVVDGEVECDVTLRPGLNAVVLVAVDLAGNVNSVGRRIVRTGVPTTLLLSPARQTLWLGESRSISGNSEFGPVASGLTWTSSDPAVVSVAGGPTPSLTGVSVGDATITATLGTLTADAVISVLDGPRSAGTVLWSVTPALSHTLGAPIVLSTTAPGAADLVAVQVDGATGERFGQALSADGVQLWTEAIDGEPAMGDVFGGMISLIPRFETGTWLAAGIVRSGGPGDVAPWRYQVPPDSWVRRFFAQSPDGTVFIVEDSDAPSGGYWSLDQSAAIVALDGTNGHVKFRVPLPYAQVNARQHGNSWCTHLVGSSRNGPGTTLPAIGENGALYLGVTHWTYTVEDYCSTDGLGNVIVGPGTGSIQKDTSADLYIVETNGEVHIRELKSTSLSGSDTPADAFTDDSVAVSSLVPDSEGGVTARWYEQFVDCSDTTDSSDPQCSVSSSGAYMTRADAGLLLSADHSVFVDPGDNPATATRAALAGDDGLLYLVEGPAGTTVRAIDTAAWTTVFNVPAGEPVMATAGGGLVTHNAASGAVTTRDSAGGIIGATTLSLVDPIFSLAYGQAQGLDPTTGGLTSVATVEVAMPRFSFRSGAVYFGSFAGNPQGQLAAISAHSTSDGAAVAALKYYNPESIDLNLEFGGSVCLRNDARYDATYPNRGVDGFSDSVVPSACSSSRTMAGRYHTHARTGNDGHSSGDIANADANPGRPWYVGTPCGNIWKYVGPPPAEQEWIARTSTSVSCSP